MRTVENKTKTAVVMGILAILLCGAITQAATGQRDSLSFVVDNRATSNAPIVTSVWRFDGSTYLSPHAYFLAGVPLGQTFSATINWNGKTPSRVRWYRNNNFLAEDDVSGTSVSRAINVGGFSVGDKLYVEAIASDNTTSSRRPANFDVIPTPPGISAATLSFSFVTGKYHQSSSFNMSLPNISYNLLEEDPDLSLTKLAQIKLMSTIGVKASIDLTGRATINSTALNAKASGFSLAGQSFSPDVEINLIFNYSGGQWHPGGNIIFSLGGELTAGPYFIWKAPPTYCEIKFRPSIYSDWKFISGLPSTPVFSADIHARAEIEAVVGVGIRNIASAELFGTGALNLKLKLPGPELNDWYLEFSAGARWEVLLFSGETVFVTHRWPEVQTLSMLSLTATRESELTPISRNYLKNGYAQWHGDVVLMKPMDIQPLDAGAFETTLQSNIFGQSDAKLAASGGTKCLVWLYDEPSRNSLDRTMLVYSINDGNGWSAPKAIDDMGRADVNPDLSVDANGNFVVTWANASQLIPDGTQLNEFMSTLGIKMAVYDAVADTWGPETVASGAGANYSPKIACDDNGDIMVLWIYDVNSDILAENPPVSNLLLARRKTPSGWQDIEIIDFVSGFIKFSDIEMDMGDIHVVYCVDTDSNVETDTDNELFYVNSVNGIWSWPLQLTDDDISDVNPQFVKTSWGLMLLWARDGRIVSATDFIGMTDLMDVVPRQGSLGQRGFTSAVSPTDNISVIWNDTSSAGSDLFTVTYDPTMHAWSQTVQITDKRDMERSISAAYSTDDRLTIAYNKVHIGEGEGLDVFGQVDLCVYEYTIGADVAVVAGSIGIDDPNAVPGDTIILQATIANVGDVVVSDIPVAFYCGDTTDPNNRIGQIQLVSGDLPAGQEAVASVSWTIPDSNEPLNVIVVADPDLEIEDKNRLNNAASVKMFGANLALANVVVSKTDRGPL